uniref:hypothetical protein n=1 Tax=Polynucleobacter sp. TaxID=2029855 RepID=UPI004047961B
MNNKIIIALVSSALLGGALQAAEPVKMSNSGICHAPNTTYYNQTKNFTPYPTLKDCLTAGGRMPKK